MAALPQSCGPPNNRMNLTRSPQTDSGPCRLSACSADPLARLIGAALPVLLICSMAAAGERDPADFVKPDERCAVEIAVTALITDIHGRPLGGAELWHLDDLGMGIPNPVAGRVGTSDARGVVKVTLCYMVPVMFCAQRPTGTRQVEFMVVKDGYAVARPKHLVDSARLLKEGLVLQGDFCKGESKSSAPPQARATNYRMALQVRLRGVS